MICDRIFKRYDALSISIEIIPFLFQIKKKILQDSLTFPSLVVFRTSPAMESVSEDFIRPGTPPPVTSTPRRTSGARSGEIDPAPLSFSDLSSASPSPLPPRPLSLSDIEQLCLICGESRGEEVDRFYNSKHNLVQEFSLVFGYDRQYDLLN